VSLLCIKSSKKNGTVEPDMESGPNQGEGWVAETYVSADNVLAASSGHVAHKPRSVRMGLEMRRDQAKVKSVSVCRHGCG
jgi:hypothetical protein